jgi:O-methyltransferase
MKKSSDQSNLLKWLGTTKILSGLRSSIGKAITHYYKNKGITLYFVNSKSWQISLDEKIGQLPEANDLIKQIKNETEMLLSYPSAYQIYTTVKKVEKITGDIAEAGVYKGGSAKLICEATKKTVHLFDTFEGLPDLSGMDDLKQFQPGNFSAAFESVKKYLENYPNVNFYKGLFPATAGPIENKSFSFVHLDLDIYESTLNCLKFFYPRMNKGGCIISHDYPGAVGVKSAFDEFFKDKPEIVIELMGCEQCLVVKV